MDARPDPATDGQAQVRPDPGDVSDEATLLRWYWLRAELAAMARRVGVSASGAKADVTARLADHFAGRKPAGTTPVVHRRDLLPVVLTGDTRVVPGQRSTQRLREWFVARVGQGFSFDAVMREAISRGDITLDELVQRWYETRRLPPTDIAPQFEFNRFARAWHAQHPDGERDEMRQAWWVHRGAPRDAAATE